MAIENSVLLNGQIRGLHILKDGEEMKQITIGLLVMRRPGAAKEDKDGFPRMDIIYIILRKPEMMQYIIDNEITEGDMLEVSGVFSTLSGLKKFHCSKCGYENGYTGSISFINPIVIRHFEIVPKKKEVITVSEKDLYMSGDGIEKVLEKHKKNQGSILAYRQVGAHDGLIDVELLVRKPISDREILKYLRSIGEISNRIYCMGNLCADPAYNDSGIGGRVCNYQLGINRKIFIHEDDERVRADFPHIRSLGEQAEKDAKCLKKGSLVFIDGSVQAREGFKVIKVCDNCGEEVELPGKAMEVIPYSVEYLRNYIGISDREDESYSDEDDDTQEEWEESWEVEDDEESGQVPSEESEEDDLGEENSGWSEDEDEDW